MKFQVLSLAALSLAAAAPSPKAHTDKHANQKKDVQIDVVTVVEYVGASDGVGYDVQTSTKAVPDNMPTAAVSSATSTRKTLQPASTASSSGSSNANTNAGSGSFQDGTIKCSDFPSVDNVVPISWLGLGGWASVMNFNGDYGTSCQDGYYCSYACSPGYSKTQWPSNQPSDGKAIGGLVCKNGYLYRTNTDASSLCEKDAATANTKNTLGKSVALCRTDYPGSENMVVPTVVGAGSSQPMSVINSDTYYQWQGKKTSSQYYVNNAGVSQENGCVWGDASGNVGNWAPLIFGAGVSNGVTYLSITKNPNSNQAANFNVKIVGEDGADIGGSCVYENGQFTSGGSDGCTVAVKSGAADFVLY